MHRRAGSQASGSQQYQPQSRRRRRPRCEQCGSARFRRDPSTSLVVCESGHVLQGFRDEEAQDGDEFNTTRSQLTRRNIKVQGRDRSGRKARKKRSVATTGVWYGDRSRFLYFQALQLILRMQVKALLQEIPGLPAEIEPICRDLWALYVSQKDNLVAQPYLEHQHDRSIREESVSSNVKSRFLQQERDSILAQEQEESENLRDLMREAGLTEDDENDENDLESQSGRTDGSEWESAMEGYDSREDGAMLAPKKRSRKGRRRKRQIEDEARTLTRQSREELDDLLCILHLALITLRVPMTWSDLCNLVKSGKLPFLNVIHQLPADVVAPFPPREVRRLDPSRVPSVRSLHHRTVALAMDLYDQAGLEFPEINSLPLLWRFVEQMLLPPTFYCAAKALLAYVNIPMHTVPPSSAVVAHASHDETEQVEPVLDSRLVVSLGKKSTARETVIMAAVLLVVKLRYGLDGDERFEEFEDPSLWSGAPSLPRWLDALSKLDKQVKLDCRSVCDAQGIDVLDMGESQLDAYLSFAERTLILKQEPRAYAWRRREDIEDILACATELDADMPLVRTDTEEKGRQLQIRKDYIEESLQTLYSSDSTKVPPSAVLSASQLRPGDAHSVYSRETDVQALHSNYRQVLHHAARLVGSTQEEMVETVYAVELALIKTLLWRRKTREAAERQRVREAQGKRKPGRPRKVPIAAFVPEEE